MLDFVEKYGQFDIQPREAVEGQNQFGEQQVVVRKSFVSLCPALSKLDPNFGFLIPFRWVLIPFPISDSSLDYLRSSRVQPAL